MSDLTNETREQLLDRLFVMWVVKFGVVTQRLRCPQYLIKLLNVVLLLLRHVHASMTLAR
jgi:hypothetical protein